MTAKERKAKERQARDRRTDPKEEKRAKELSKATVTSAAIIDTVQRTVQSREHVSDDYQPHTPFVFMAHELGGITH